MSALIERKKVATRLLALLACVYQSNLAGEQDSDRDDARLELVKWVTQYKISAELSKNEFDFVFNINNCANKISGTQYSWYEEQVGVCAWALGFDLEVENYETQIELNNEFIFDKFHFLNEIPIEKILNNSDYIDYKEIENGRDFYYALRHRLFNENLNFQNSMLAKGNYFPFQMKIIDGDLGFLGQSIKRLDVTQLDLLTSIVTERYKAFNMLFIQEVN
jgi:hypothetical protein